MKDNYNEYGMELNSGGRLMGPGGGARLRGSRLVRGVGGEGVGSRCKYAIYIFKNRDTFTNILCCRFLLY